MKNGPKLVKGQPNADKMYLEIDGYFRKMKGVAYFCTIFS